MSIIGNRYSRALYEAASETKATTQELDSISQVMEYLSAALEVSKEFGLVLKSPTITDEEKLKVLEDMIAKQNAPAIVGRFFALLAKKGRLSSLEEIAADFAQVRLEAEGAILGKVESADALKDTDLEDLARAFTKKMGKRVVFKTSINPDLLAGMKVTVSGVTYDGSMRAQLNQVGERLTQGTRKGMY